jgi:hypothetical protein
MKEIGKGDEIRGAEEMKVAMEVMDSRETDGSGKECSKNGCWRKGERRRQMERRVLKKDV